LRLTKIQELKSKMTDALVQTITVISQKSNGFLQFDHSLYFKKIVTIAKRNAAKSLRKNKIVLIYSRFSRTR